MSYTHRPRGLAVPETRFGRMARLGTMVAGVAGNMAIHGSKELARGRKPSFDALLLTPGNAARITKQLSQMRGAAMKMGQLISMEGGDFLPKELSDILAHLREDAHFMPPPQLKSVLAKRWGAQFVTRFQHFDVRPIAAASIGQVHRARTRDGRDVAIKVQYAGVRTSIDTDVANVATLLRLSGLLPSELDMAPLLEEARKQLHEEADYAREATALTGFGQHLDGTSRFKVPRFHSDLSAEDILCMDYVESVPIERLMESPQATRDAVLRDLIALFLRELFEFHEMQTDPNFANYRYRMDDDQIVLLDFGATRQFASEMVAPFRALLVAGVAQDRAAIARQLQEIGYLGEGALPHHDRQILDMTEIAFSPFLSDGAFDFAHNDIVPKLRDMGMAFASARDYWVIPPMDTLYIQRKLGGLYLLGARLKAKVALRPLLQPYL